MILLVGVFFPRKGGNQMSATKTASAELLTLEEFWKKARISERTARELLAQEKIPFYKIGGSIRIDWNEVREYTRRPK